MWKTIVTYIPDFTIILQAIVTFLVPYGISRFFKWIHSLEKE